MEPGSQNRLESWKQIAAHFGRSIACVQRWEKSEGLPVRRHDHNALASVYAFPEELDAWQAQRDRAAVRPPRRLRPWMALAAIPLVATAGAAV